MASKMNNENVHCNEMLQSKIATNTDVTSSDVSACISSGAFSALSAALTAGVPVSGISEHLLNALRDERRVSDKVVCLHLLQRCVGGARVCDLSDDVDSAQRIRFATVFMDALLRSEEVSQFAPEIAQEMFRRRGDSDFLYRVVCCLLREQIRDYLDATLECADVDGGEFLPASFRDGFVESLGNIVRLAFQFRGGFAGIEENFILKLSDRIGRTVEKMKAFSQKFFAMKSRETYSEIIQLKIRNLKRDWKVILERYIGEFDREKIDSVIGMIRGYLIRVIDGDEIGENDPEPNQFTFLMLSYVISILGLFKDNAELAEKHLNGFISSLSDDFEQSLKQDLQELYEQLCVLPKQILSQIQNENTESYNCFKQATSAFLTPIFYANCILLEDLVQLEILFNSMRTKTPKEIMIYPAQNEELFEKYLRNDNKIIEFLKSDMENWLKIIYKLIDITVPYLSQVRGMPGCVCEIDFKNFVPLKEWKWKEIPHVTFPKKPQDVCKLISSKLSLIQQFEQYKYSCNFHKCLKCKNKNADVVCQKCRKLVLCNDCKSSNDKCPNCENVF